LGKLRLKIAHFLGKYGSGHDQSAFACIESRAGNLLIDKIQGFLDRHVFIRGLVFHIVSFNKAISY